MQERVLKATVIILSALLAALVALGAFLVAGTQGGRTASFIESVYPQPSAHAYQPETLPATDS